MYGEKKERKMLSKKAVLERGWTEKLIGELLPGPKLVENPYNSKYPIKLWHIDAVRAREGHPEIISRKLKQVLNELRAAIQQAEHRASIEKAAWESASVLVPQVGGELALDELDAYLD